MLIGFSNDVVMAVTCPPSHLMNNLWASVYFIHFHHLLCTDSWSHVTFLHFPRLSFPLSLSPVFPFLLHSFAITTATTPRCWLNCKLTVSEVRHEMMRQHEKLSRNTQCQKTPRHPCSFHICSPFIFFFILLFCAPCPGSLSSMLTMY